MSSRAALELAPKPRGPIRQQALPEAHPACWTDRFTDDDGHDQRAIEEQTSMGCDVTVVWEHDVWKGLGSIAPELAVDAWARRGRTQKGGAR